MQSLFTTIKFVNGLDYHDLQKPLDNSSISTHKQSRHIQKLNQITRNITYNLSQTYKLIYYIDQASFSKDILQFIVSFCNFCIDLTLVEALDTKAEENINQLLYSISQQESNYTESMRVFTVMVDYLTKTSQPCQILNNTDCFRLLFQKLLKEDCTTDEYLESIKFLISYASTVECALDLYNKGVFEILENVHFFKNIDKQAEY